MIQKAVNMQKINCHNLSFFKLRTTAKYMKSRRFEIQALGLREGDMEHTELSGGQKPAYFLYTML